MKGLWTYEGDLIVNYSMVKNGKFIKGCIPDIIKGNFNSEHNIILNYLEGGPKEITGNFSINNNQLITLEGGPMKVDGNFMCFNNKLTSLKGCPKEIGGGFYCNYNKLNSLEGIPKKLGGFLYCDLDIEKKFINSGSYINNYWEDLLVYMIKEKINLTRVKSWPKGFLSNDVIKSAKGLNKFKL